MGHWTRRQLAILENQIETVPLARLVEQIRKSPEAIKKKAARLGCHSIQTTLDNYSAKFLAEQLGIGPPTVHHWIKQGWLKAEKFGDKWAIKASDFAAFCQQHPKRVRRLNPDAVAWLSHQKL